MQGANKRDGIKLPHVSKHIIMNINNFKSTNLYHLQQIHLIVDSVSIETHKLLRVLCHVCISLKITVGMKWTQHWFWFGRNCKRWLDVLVLVLMKC